MSTKWIREYRKRKLKSLYGESQSSSRRKSKKKSRKRYSDYAITFKQMFKSMKHVSVEELAAILGVEKDLLMKLSNEGIIPGLIDGEFYPANVAVLVVEALASSVLYEDGKAFLSKPKIKAYLMRYLGEFKNGEDNSRASEN